MMAMVVFVVYGLRTMALLDSVHYSLSGSGLSKLPAANININIEDIHSSNGRIDASLLQKREACWTLPVEVPSAEISPKKFMEEGPGKDYLALYQKQVAQKTRPVLRVRFALYHLLTTCQPVYYHIHKNGGTTMNVKDNPVVDAFYTAREHTLGRTQFQNETNLILNDIYKSQHQPAIASRDMPFFTFLRDPVRRFLSGVGQALKLNKVAPCNQQQDTVSLIDCVLTKIKDSESFLDEHLEPQAFELYHGIVGLDLSIQVMDISALSALLSHLGFGSGAGDAPKRRMSMSSRGSRRTNYNLSVTSLTPSLIERICETYRVDLLLLQMAGISKSICIEPI
jgi:hypothetical protein